MELDDDELDGPKHFTRFRGFRILRNNEDEPSSSKMSPEERERRVEFLANRADQGLNLFDMDDTTVYPKSEKREEPQE